MMIIRSQIELTNTHMRKAWFYLVPAKAVSTIFQLHLRHEGIKTESEAPGVNLEAEQCPSSQPTNLTALPEFKLEPKQ